MDVGRILDVHFWPFWDHGADPKIVDRSIDTVFRDFTNRRGFALVLFKSDMQIVHDFFAFGYFVGIHLGFQRLDYSPGKQKGWGACTGQFSNLNLDQCTVGINFHATDKSGIQITNANIVCRDLPKNNPTHNQAPINRSVTPSLHIRTQICITGLPGRADSSHFAAPVFMGSQRIL